MRRSDGTLPVPVSNGQVRATYDAVAGVYARTVARLEGPSQRQALLGLDLKAGETVVDVGCGPGGVLPYLARRVGPGGRVLGVDAAPGMVEAAARRVERAGCGDRVSLALGDARRLPLTTGAADAVCALDVLDLFDRASLRTVLRECRRVLAPDGALCVVTMAREDVPDAAFLRVYEWAYEHLPGFGTVGCRPIPVDEALREAGFAVRSRDRLRRGGVWPVAALRCVPRPDR